MARPDDARAGGAHPPGCARAGQAGIIQESIHTSTVPGTVYFVFSTFLLFQIVLFLEQPI